jgi:peptidyl-prolyl cis-trans isomerase A (cyclophilin A)
LAIACEKAPPEPKSKSNELVVEQQPVEEPAPTMEAAEVVKASSSTPEAPASSAAGEASVAEEVVATSGPDPLGGKFTLTQALLGLEGKGAIYADLDTAKGKLSCKLYDDKAPVTVANFVGLARGLRPFKNPQGSWVKKPAYDGTTFHRVIKGFMVQGGDPNGNGSGEPGYVIPDEVWTGATHDRKGLMCMANRGKDTNGMQFFILHEAAKHLDHSYTIFGECSPGSVIDAIAEAPVRGDRAVDPPKINKVSVRREK